MKISSGNVILQIGKTFWRYFATLYHILYHSIYFTTYKGHLSSLIYYIWKQGIHFVFLSNNACLEFLLSSSQSGRSHAVPIQYLG